jgi:hypothetical protein
MRAFAREYGRTVDQLAIGASAIEELPGEPQTLWQTQSSDLTS